MDPNQTFEDIVWSVHGFDYSKINIPTIVVNYEVG